MREALAQMNKRSRGLRGSSAIRLYDWEYMRLTGHDYILQLPDGTKLLPASLATATGWCLDWIIPTGGGLIMRLADGWGPAPIDPDTRAYLSP